MLLYFFSILEFQKYETHYVWCDDLKESNGIQEQGETIIS